MQRKKSSFSDVLLTAAPCGRIMTTTPGYEELLHGNLFVGEGVVEFPHFTTWRLLFGEFSGLNY